jgi:hypothetical protein
MKQNKEVTSREVMEEIFPEAAKRPSPDWLMRYTRKGVVPHTRKIGRAYLFDVDAVRKALQAKGIIP